MKEINLPNDEIIKNDIINNEKNRMQNLNQTKILLFNNITITFSHIPFGIYLIM